MQEGTLIKTDGTETKVVAKNGVEFDLAELQEYVGGFIQFLPLPDGRKMCVNENGKIDGLPRNIKAQEVWTLAYPPEKFSIEEYDQLIVGDVVLI